VLKYFFLTFIVICGAVALRAQDYLQRSVRVVATEKPLSEVLREIGRQAGFTFSYGNNAVAGRRLVTINAPSTTVAKALDELLKGTCAYKEVGKHVVLQPAVDKYYEMSGYVLDASSGQGIAQASVYERQQLVAAMTNDEGYFQLRLRHQYPTADISISKEKYQDTVVFVANVENRPYRLPVRPVVPKELDEFVVTDAPQKRLLDQWLSRLVIGNKLRDQSRNITSFIATRPVQTSFVPGLGTHGRIGAQVVNKFSLNVLGGYTAGVNGIEIGGLFNIDRGNVQYTQIGGLFNIVGGNVRGVEVGGLSNSVQDSVNGLQVAGLSNVTGGSVEGVQVSGISNITAGQLGGAQIGGIVNTVADTASGIQVSGLINIAGRKMRGAQVAGIFNFAHNLNGVQVGLINVTDTIEGASFGLINLSKNGYHKLVFYSDEVVPVNAALKTGNHVVYTILFTGYNPSQKNQVFSFGAGLGHQCRFSKQWSLTLEATVQHLYLGDWEQSRLLYRVRPSICYQPRSWLSIFTGPSANAYNAGQGFIPRDFMQSPASRGWGSYSPGTDWQAWIGWQAGIAFF
jgi:hypothetical protein